MIVMEPSRRAPKWRKEHDFGVLSISLQSLLCSVLADWVILSNLVVDIYSLGDFPHLRNRNKCLVNQ